MTKSKESGKKTGLLPWTKPSSWTHNSIVHGLAMGQNNLQPPEQTSNDEQS